MVTDNTKTRLAEGGDGAQLARVVTLSTSLDLASKTDLPPRWKLKSFEKKKRGE